MPSGDDAYQMPRRVCATCGRPTANPRNGGVGEWHHDCRRDPQGHLLVRPEPKPSEATA